MTGTGLSVLRAYAQKPIIAVQQTVEDSPETLVRRRAQKLVMKKAFVSRTLKEDLNLYPYKLQPVHALKHTDYLRRRTLQ